MTIKIASGERRQYIRAGGKEWPDQRDPDGKGERRRVSELRAVVQSAYVNLTDESMGILVTALRRSPEPSDDGPERALHADTRKK